MKIINYLKYLSKAIKSPKEMKRYLRHLLFCLYEKITTEDKVTVVIPVWDRTSELEESIKSILCQSHKNIELILVTDGSPKETINIIKKHEDNPRVKIFYYNDNSGNAVRGRNKAIREASGKYFAFQDSDDIADRNRIKTSLKYIKRFSVDGVYGGWEAKLDGTRLDTGLKDGQVVLSPDCDIKTMKELCVPCQSTVMIKTAILKKLGGLKEDMKYREDHELWLRFMNKGYKFKAIPKVLTKLRIHEGNAELLFKDKDYLWKKTLMKEYIRSHRLKEKIAYIIPTTGVGGGLAVIIQHANRLIERGYDVFLISEDCKSEINWMNCNAQVVPMNSPNKYYFENIDLLIATGWSTVQYLEKFDSQRKLYFCQSDERRFFEKYQKSLIKQVEETYKKPYEFFTEAVWIQRWLKDEFKKEAYYVPNGLDTEIFHNTKPLEKKGKKKRILLEGPISLWFKGMTDAYYSVKDLDCEIWIVSGKGEPPTYWRYDRFFESVPINEMKKIYSSCDILLKLSRVEGFFGPPLEAMACGCIPVVSKVSGYDEYIVNEYNALVVDTGDTKMAENAIKRLIESKELREVLKSNGKKTVGEWDWNRSIDLLEKVIRKEPIKEYYTDSWPAIYDYKEERRKLYELK